MWVSVRSDMVDAALFGQLLIALLCLVNVWFLVISHLDNMVS